MDPVTHSLTGAALSRAGLNRTTPLATATLVLAANAPDIDVVAMAAGSYGALAFRRGVTHGPIALLLLPFVVTGAMLLYDLVVRRRRQADAPPVLALPTLGLATLGVLTHPALDWLNTYGIRLLMPFSERWFYGDSVFIIDPWIWLALAVPLVGVYTASRRAAVLWAGLAVAATALVMLAPQVPLAARLLWVAGVAAVVAHVLRSRRALEPAEPPAAVTHGAGSHGSHGNRGTRGARIAVAAVGAYIVLMIVADALARTRTVAAAAAAGIVVRDVMVAPAPANPLAGDVVVSDGLAYHLGRFEWLRSPHVTWEAQPIPLGERDEYVLATLQLQPVRDFLRWSRFPFVEVQETADGRTVRFGDARYPGRMRGGLGGITVQVEHSLRATPQP